MLQVLRVFLGMRHQLGTEVADGKEVIRPFNEQSVLLIKHRQAVKTHTEMMAFYSGDDMIAGT